MAIQQLIVRGYRSIRDVHLELGRIAVIVGPNGCGKSNLYRSMFLLFAAASGRFARAIVDEGGMPSVLWAGARTTGPVRMKIGATVGQLEYELSCGLPPLSASVFSLDPELKEEKIWFLDGRTRVPMLERGRTSVTARDATGKRLSYPMALDGSESVLAQLREPHRFPQLSSLRQEILSWRFYHQFRTDSDSPLRFPQVAIWTPALSHDGCDLANALQTIVEIGDRGALEEEVERAFPDSTLHIVSEGARLGVALQTRGFQRPFDARELSDGTLRYLCLMAALLSPRPPAVLALNEPETSIHPDLLPALAGLIARAAEQTQLWITTHSEPLAEHLRESCGVSPIRLEKINGETKVLRD